jgi:hypothetical protein
MPGFNSAGARKAPAPQRLYRRKNACDAKQNRQPQRRPECEACSDKKTKRNDRPNGSSFLIDVGSKESLHIAKSN